MPDREALVIACENRIFGELKFVPGLGQEIFDILTSPEYGNCNRQNSKLKHNPTRDEIEDAFVGAFRDAAGRSSDLIIYFLGHGHYIGGIESFYLVAADSDSNSKVVAVGDLLKRAFATTPSLRGFAIILDTCFAGGIAADIIQDLVGKLTYACMAGVAEGLAYNGCFTKSLIQIAQNGIAAERDENLGWDKLKAEIGNLCPTQAEPVVNLFLQRGKIPYVAKNLAAAHLGIRDHPLPAAFQPTAALLKIVRTSQGKEIVRVIGSRGSGKTTLARAIAEPAGISGFVPAGFAHAVAFVDDAVLPGNLALDLNRQLRRSSPEFEAAYKDFESDSNITEQQKKDMPPLRRYVVEPARRMAPSASVRIVLSGLHLLNGSVLGERILKSLGELATLRCVRLVLFSRVKDGLPGAAPVDVTLGWALPEELKQYLTARGIESPVQSRILELSGWNWETTAQLADLAGSSPEALPSQSEIYDVMLAGIDLGAAEWKLLGLVAAAGSGPVLPFQLLCAALKEFKEPCEPADARKMLARVGRLVGPDQSAEMLGLSIDAMSATILERCRTRLAIDRPAFDRALSNGIAALVPKGLSAPMDPLFRYAWAREPEHLWNLESFAELIDSLRWRESPYASEQLARWQGWHARLVEKPGAAAAQTLFAECEIARLSLDLLLREVNPDPPDVTEARKKHREAVRHLINAHGLRRRECLVALLRWGAQEGDRGSHQYAKLVSRGVLRRMSDWEPNDPDRLVAEYQDVLWSRYLIMSPAELPELPELLERSSELLGRMEATLGIDSRFAMDLKGIVASLIAEQSPADGVAAYEDLLQRQLTLLGPGTADVLTTMHALVFYKRKAGLKKEAYSLSRALVEDQIRYFGPQHADTLATRLMVTQLGGVTRFVSAEETRDQMAALLHDAERVLEPGQDLRLTIMTHLAFWTAKSGNYAAANELAKSVCAAIGNARRERWQRLAHHIVGICQRKSASART